MPNHKFRFGLKTFLIVTTIVSLAVGYFGMKIYREMTGIRSQNEQIQGQLNVLSRRVALSTITVNLRPSEDAKPVLTASTFPE